MGWTFYEATHHKANGDVDRKAECDALNTDGTHMVLKSAMVGSVYYAAIAKTDGFMVDKVFAVIFLTDEDKHSGMGFEFGYKDMDETEAPYYYTCPVSILNLLTPTDNKCANEWRDACRKNAEKSKSPNALKNLPIGSQIDVEYGDEHIILTKCAPAYQFKRPFWYDAESGKYLPATRIKNYTVLAS
jgi:hypothetical protein